MNIIGISGLANSVSFKQKELPGLSPREYHIAQGFDAAAALVGPGGVIAAAAEERFTREKATGAFPIQAIRYCLQAGNLRPDDIDLIAHGFSYEPYKSAFEVDEYSRRQYREVYCPEAQRRLLKEHFGDANWSRRFVPVPHHLAHAASAFYPSGFDEALILISDGMGEVQSMTVATGKGAEITVLAEVPAFHSLGVLYGVFTLYLGFWMGSDEYKVMGLAPYGNPRRFYDQIKQFVSLKEDGTYTIPAFASNRSLRDRETHAGMLQLLADQFGPPREPEAEITQFHQDLAAGLQAVVQTCQLHVLRHFQQRTGQRNLCMAGGVALNCSANGVIKRSQLFDKVFVQPAAGDDGTALGAALYAQRLYDPQFKPSRMGVPLWGPEFTDNEIRQAVAGREDCTLLEPDSYDALCQEVAARIDQGQIVAWFQGRMEFGPRALGSRSILADPRGPDMRDRINSLVKKREGFRPFAPVVAAEAATRMFEIAPGDADTYAHMLFVTQVRPEHRESLPAITHVDGSARVQTVSRDQNPRLWQLLNAFAQRSGLPVLLNTSFNVRGQPIVCTPKEAVETFLFAKLDVLVAGNLIVLPKRADAPREPVAPKALSPAEPRPAPAPQASPATAQSVSRLRDLYATATCNEEFWVQRLSSLEPTTLPYKSRDSEPSSSPVWAKLSRPIARETLAAAKASQGLVSNAEWLLAAYAAFLARLNSGAGESSDSPAKGPQLGLGDWRLKAQLDGFEHLFATVLPLCLQVDLEKNFAETLIDVRAELDNVRSRQTYARAVFARYPALRGPDGSPGHASLPLAVQIVKTSGEQDPASGAELTFVLAEQATECVWIYDTNRFDAETVALIAGQFSSFLAALAANPGRALARISLLNEEERRRVLVEWNQTQVPFPDQVCLHEFIGAQAKRTPDDVAVVFENQQLTYAELDRRANQLAWHLRKLEVGPEVLVGVCLEVSLEMVIGLLGVLKAGGAYVPLDPDYPKERLGFMIRDARTPVVITQQSLVGFVREALAGSPSGAAQRPEATTAPGANGAKGAPPEPKVVSLDSEWELIGKESIEPPVAQVGSDNLAYVIYTSGSTGTPKGVMVRHRNVVNFFTGMDERLGAEAPGVWLAVTSISFDISVLELFWTLARGFKVVLRRKEGSVARPTVTLRSSSSRPLDFSLFYFASNESEPQAQKYRLLLEGARFADKHGFAAVWTPERHFHAFGGLYPNPAVTGAAVAAITRHVSIRAGSVVLPLHNPIRVAEEWAVVDNLSNGRVSVSFASGWQINDFALAPGNYARRKELMFEQIELVRRLWRGETVAFPGPGGREIPVSILPRPVQPELPIWITASGNPDTFQVAGQLGAHLLTHLLGQSLREVEEKIAIYRRAWKRQGHLGEGRVALMLHTFVGDNLDTVRETVRQPFTTYLRSSIDLIKNAPAAFSAFKQPSSAWPTPGNGEHAGFTEEEIEVMASYAFERYFETSGLFGTVPVCAELAAQFRGIGVDEIACLVDFGVETGLALESLKRLNEVRAQAGASVRSTTTDYSLPALVARHRVTHLQCTPSLAAMLAEDPRALQAMQSLRVVMLGGEALPADLVHELNLRGKLLNMYGPTETTVWSTTHAVMAAVPSAPQPSLQSHAGSFPQRQELAPVAAPAPVQIESVPDQAPGAANSGMLPACSVAARTLSGEAPASLSPAAAARTVSSHPQDTPATSPAPSLGVVPIGRPIANTEIYLVDRFLEPVPVGVPGELLIGGAGVVRGYLNRPELTSQKFIPNPFNPEPGARLYRTGDLARYRADGSLEFLGRIDQQVKLRGFRIELGEIETALRQHPEIKDCAAQVREDSPGDKRLVAYIVPTTAEVPAAKSLREFLRQKLPEYMVPTAFVVLPALPLTPNGKLDRKSLPAPAAARHSAAVLDPPRSEAEKQVARVWCELFGLSQVARHDNFFELGGNSVLATQLISRLRPIFGRELPLGLAFEHPTLHALAGALAGEANTSGGQSAPAHQPILRRANPEEAPLSFAQQRLWFLDQLEPGPHYNDHFDLRLSGPVDARALESALNQIIRRHETLRATFTKRDGSPIQVIQPELKIPLPLIDLSGRPEAERETEAVRLAVEQGRQLFDLEQGPLLRAKLLRLGAEEHILALTLHHIVIDGWSRGVLLRELAVLYQAALDSQASPLPALPIQYADFAAWQQQALQGEATRQHLEYWRRQLRDAPPLLELPTDYPRPAVQTYRGARQNLVLDKALVDQMSALGRQEGCTLFMVLVAAFQTLLARYSGRDDILIGSPIASRNRAEVEGLVGYFLNSLVLRTDFSGGPTFTQLLQRVRKLALEAYEHQDLPFERLVAELQPVRDLSYSPIFQVLFVLQNAPMPSAHAGALTLRPFEIDTGISKFDLTLNLEETPQGCSGWVEYATELFEARTIQCLIRDFRAILERVGAHPEERVSELPVSGLRPALPAPTDPRPAGGTPAMLEADSLIPSGARASGAGPVAPSLEVPSRSTLPSKAPLVSPDRADQAPHTEVQRKLAQVWAEVLGAKDISLNDSVFDLGAHSLLITKIISRIRRAFEADVPIQAFFETPTLAEIAAIIEESLRHEHAPLRTPAIQRITRIPHAQAKS